MLATDETRSGSNRGPRVVSANLSHLDAIVQIHQLAFDGFFLESLGQKFLRELYRGFLNDPSAVSLVAIDGDEVLGFVVGTSQPEGFFRRLLWSRGCAFMFAGAAALASHPIRVGKKFLFALQYRGEKPADIPNASLLSSIGVAPSGKGRGVGKILLAAFCERARELGTPTVFLTTDRLENEAVNRFYLSNGFALHSSFLKDRSRWMNLYTRSLIESQTSEDVLVGGQSNQRD